jgi:hypothetical protein
VVDHEGTTQLLERAGVLPVAQRHALRGLGDSLTVYELP